MFRLSRHLEEGARVCGRRVASLRSPALPFDLDVVEVLPRCQQQIVQAVDLRTGVGQAPAALHHSVKAVVVLDLERDEERDDRIPRIGSPRPQQIPAHLTLEPVAARFVRRRVDTHHISFTQRLVTLDRLVITLGDWFEDARVEHTHVGRKSGDDDVRVEGGDRSCGHRVSGVHQHFEPLAEAIDVELPVASRPRGTPQIEVEHGGELCGGRRRDELAARIESTVANELMQGLRRKVRNDAREEWCIQQSREPILGRARVAGRRIAVRDFGHGPAMIPVLASNKQS